MLAKNDSLVRSKLGTCGTCPICVSRITADFDSGTLRDVLLFLRKGEKREKGLISGASGGKIQL
jgi:hypothetical protein